MVALAADEDGLGDGGRFILLMAMVARRDPLVKGLSLVR